MALSKLAQFAKVLAAISYKFRVERSAVIIPLAAGTSDCKGNYAAFGSAGASNSSPSACPLSPHAAESSSSTDSNDNSAADEFTNTPSSAFAHIFSGNIKISTASAKESTLKGEHFS